MTERVRGSVPLSVIEGGGHAPAQQPVLRGPAIVSFDRHELGQIMAVYGLKVGRGEWRDYALDFLKERAVFSAFARNSERPLFTVEKWPRLRAKQGQYLVTNQVGRVLKRGNDLRLVLNVLEPHYAVVD